jgi:hypothetical protein
MIDQIHLAWPGCKSALCGNFFPPVLFSIDFLILFVILI